MALHSSNLQFSYSREKSFHFPDIDLSRGDSALLLGSSGVGKTTLLHILAGLLPPLSGNVKVGQTDLFSLNSKQRDKFRGRNIGIIFQKSFFLPYLSITENLKLAVQLQGKSTSEKQLIKELDELGVSSIAHQLPAQCSVGEQQRASIARALLQKPAIILADEPTSALDDANAEKVGMLLKEMAQNHNAALLVVTHDARLKKLFQKTYQL